MRKGCLSHVIAMVQKSALPCRHPGRSNTGFPRSERTQRRSGQAGRQHAGIRCCRRAWATLVELTRSWKPDGQTQKGGEGMLRGATHASQGRSSADWGDHGSTGVSLCWEGAEITMGSCMIVSSQSVTRSLAASKTACRSASRDVMLRAEMCRRRSMITRSGT